MSKLHLLPRLTAKVLGLLLIPILAGCNAEKYHSSISPDRRFEVMFYITPSLVAMPGSGSDVDGFIQLVESKTGDILATVNVDAIRQRGCDVRWTPTQVSIASSSRSIATWPLPK
jgi:hypothetical protein